MKKIINGRLYDTDTAKRIGYDGGGDGFSHWYEELYQKRTGEFFLYGEGGPMTKYAVSCGQNQWAGGAKIQPLTLANAKAWAEEHLSVDDYEAAFGLPEEDNDVVDVHVQMPAALVARMKQTAVEQGLSLTAYIANVLRNELGS